MRLPSQDMNNELTSKAERYRTILEQAAASDGVVRSKWEEWEEHITELTWSEVRQLWPLPLLVLMYQR